jgi:hypothetical protein
MSSSLEAELRSTLGECAGLMPADAELRLARIDYWPQSRHVPRRLRVWSMASAVGVAVAGCVIAATLLFSSSTGPLGVRSLGVPMAYADWSATPVTPTPAALATAVAACNRSDSMKLSGQPVLADARGKYIAVVYVSGGDVSYCISDRHNNEGGGGGLLAGFGVPEADQLGRPGGGGGYAPGFPGGNPNERLPLGTRKAIESLPPVKNNPSLRAGVEAYHAAMEYHILGTAGSDIASATFVFANDRTVTATVQNGWYFAWWPNIDQPVSVQVTTRSGSTITSQWHCKPGTTSCMFAAPS